MDPRFMLEAAGFRASSGNRVNYLVELGVDGFNVRWELTPSKQDAEEFDRWAKTKLDVDIETHMERQDSPIGGLQQSRQAYAAWKKKLEGSS